MEQVGYSLINNSNTEIQYWGNTQGQIPGIPNIVVLPNGDIINAPSLGSYGLYKLVKRMIDDNKPTIWYKKISENISYDSANGNIVVTYVYPGSPSLLPDFVSPLQIRKALRQLGLKANLESYIATLSGDEKDEWEYSLLLTPSNKIIANAAIFLGKTQDDVNAVFRLAYTK